MDVDNDNFYDEMSSFMPAPGEYSLDDLDEIIRSTDSHLDASLDLNIFSKSLEQNDFEMGDSTSLSGSSGGAGGGLNFADTFGINLEQPQNRPENQLTATQPNEFSFNFSAFPSPATSHLSSSGDYTSPYETPARTSSTSSVDGDHFNPDDFINFLNDDDVKVEGLTHDTIRQLNESNERNTPSPTGSCTSSSGSSTSGIQSDVSSIASMPQNVGFALANEQDRADLSEFIKFKTDKYNNDLVMQEGQNLDATETTTTQQSDGSIGPAVEANNYVAGTTLVPLTLPMLPVATFQPVQPVNILQGTIIPVQTVPLTSVTPVVNIKSSAFTKIDKASNSKAQQPVKVVPTTKTATVQSSPANNVTASAKLSTPPTNAKPKTIFLSSNDFKALMQKMNNTNGVNGSKKPSFPNGQMPKIIMKTASGKYITANKVPASSVVQTTGNNASSTTATSSSNASSSSQQHSSSQINSKMFKNAGSMMGKQHQQQHLSKSNPTNGRTAAAMAAAARASVTHSKGCRTDFNMLKGLSDDKIIKKQLRMLKNRESASLSRKKKKEYVERLEHRISNLEKENYSLKGENTSLRSQLMAFAQTCNCKHRNVSEFILSTLSMNERRHSASSVLSDLDTSFLIDEDSSDQSECMTGDTASLNSATTARTATQHVRIAPKPLNASSSINNKGFKHRMNAATVKKNVAVLFAMAFMVTLNVGNFQSYLNKSALENALEATAGAASTNEAEPAAVSTGRRLLWVPNEHEFHEQNNRSKREADFSNMPPPPLHFLRPLNRTTADKLNGTSTKDEPPIKALPTMMKYGSTVFGNGTNYAQENNMRLARNLHKWIGGNDYLNLTGSGNDIGKRMAQFKFGTTTADYAADYDIQTPTPAAGMKRKIFLSSNNGDDTAEKQTKYDADASDKNSLDLFKPRINEEYLKLFKGIKRQDDTFYVLSFNLDHVLLPASAYNKSARPKMSLMLPTGDPSMNGDVILMQIDCEVMNTTELELKSHMIPDKLKPVKYGPAGNVRVNPNDVANNETKSGGAASKTGNGIHLKREEDSKEKPAAPRTYFMMGPKNQSSGSKTTSAGETIIKKRPTIVKLNANDSVIGSGVMNVRNSTLFTRMKETVGGSGSSGFVAAAASDVRKLM